MIGKGIEINNIHTYRDLGVSISSKSIGAPALNRITESVPFMNGVYDFSDMFEEETYGERVLQYEFDLSDVSKGLVNAKKMKIINFFKNNRNSILRDDTVRGYHFNFVRMIEHSFKESGLEGKLTVSLATQPFKVRDIYEGNNSWDDFNFELDILQDTKFEISNMTDIVIHNVGGKKVIPEIICSSSMEVVKDNMTYKLKKGSNKDYRFKLDVGANNITVKGNGFIEFKFRKELL